MALDTDTDDTGNNHIRDELIRKRKAKFEQNQVALAEHLPKGNVERISIGVKPHKYQLQAYMQAIKYRFLVVVAHRRFGKTFWAILVLLTRAMADTSGNGRYAYIAPYLKQAVRIAWDYLVMFSKRIPGVKVSLSDHEITLPNGAKITLYGADNDDAIRGSFFDGVVLDELADMSPDTWPLVVRPALADRMGWAIFIGTPKGMNMFYDLFTKALDAWNWAALSFPVSMTKLLPEEELEDIRADLSENQYAQEMECDFTASSDDILIPSSVVLKARNRKQPDPQSLTGYPKYLTLDPARFGSDNSVITKSQGPMVWPQIRKAGLDNMVLADLMDTIIADFQPDMILIDGGRGEGVIDRLRQMGHTNVMEINSQGTPPNPKYLNMRAYMWAEMGKAMDNYLCLPADCTELATESSIPWYWINDQGKLQLASKKEIKKRGRPSPDHADSLALRFAVRLAMNSNGQPARTQSHGGRETVVPQYDPSDEW